MDAGYEYEIQLRRQGYLRICGVDEVGRGPWAGPVLACAVILPDAPMEGLRDSKKLTERRRAALCDQLKITAAFGLGAASVREIDALNISQATFLAMTRAVAQLTRKLGAPPDAALVDGPRAPELPCAAFALPKGDAISASVAAASIIAKQTRDAMMRALARRHPGYGWESNMGYGVAAHRAGLERLAVTRHHRITFKPIQKIIQKNKANSI